jgi:hypothetical protein
MAVGLILMSIATMLPFFFVSPDLRGSRYLYLGSAGWAIVLCAVGATVAAQSSALARVAAGALIVMISVDVVAVRLHLRPWRAAASSRDRVERAALATQDLMACRSVHLSDLPDTADGAYVFRNGAAEAFARDLRIEASIDDTVGPCSFRWTGEQFVPSRR